MALLTILSDCFSRLNTNGIASTGKQSITLNAIGAGVNRATLETIHISKSLTQLRVYQKEIVLAFSTKR